MATLQNADFCLQQLEAPIKVHVCPYCYLCINSTQLYMDIFQKTHGQKKSMHDKDIYRCKTFCNMGRKGTAVLQMHFQELVYVSV